MNYKQILAGMAAGAVLATGATLYVVNRQTPTIVAPTAQVLQAKLEKDYTDKRVEEIANDALAEIRNKSVSTPSELEGLWSLRQRVAEGGETKTGERSND